MIMGINQMLMYLFLALYAVVFTKSLRSKRLLKYVGVYTIPALLVITLFMSIANWYFYAVSHCKDKTYGSAAIISNNLLFILTLITIAGSLITFVMLSNRNGGSGRVSH